MRTGWMALAAGVLAASAVGCGESLDGAALVDESAELVCESLLACCDERGALEEASWLREPVGEASCRDDYRGRYASLGARWERAVSSGRMRYDAAARARCVESLRAGDCGAAHRAMVLGPALCDAVLEGAQDVGESCSAPSECRSGFCPDGTCRAVASEGEPCTEASLCVSGECRPFFVCGDGLFCDAARVCRTRVAVGAPCGGAPGECERGATCAGVCVEETLVLCGAR